MTTGAPVVVFAYHQVGVRCLKALISGGADVRLVVTHEDNPRETIWWERVADVAIEHGIDCIAPADANTDEVVARVRSCSPDFLFSFYYRHMLKAPLLAAPRRGAFNMHGSLLPQYRGRVPVNWAVLRGETETGATLHVMNEKPDNGAIVDQCAVPILEDDTAREVFDKVTVAAEIVMARSLPRLVDGSASFTPQDLSLGGYFGGRKPEDGRIPADASARQIHDLVRALAPPYPGAFFDAQGQRIVIERTRRVARRSTEEARGRFELHADASGLWLTAGDGETLRVLRATLQERVLTPEALAQTFGRARVAPDL